MKRWGVLVAPLGMSAAVAILTSVGRATPAAGFYWPSPEVELAITQSDWGDARNVGSATCYGVGAYRKQLGEYTFKRFRCALDKRTSPWNRIGFVTIYTTGPESWKPANFIKPRCG